MKRNLIIATLLAPLAIVPAGLVAMTIITAFDVGRETDWGFADMWSTAIQLAIFGIPVSFAAVIVIGWPVHYLALRLDQHSAWPYLVAGLFGGVGIGFVSATFYRPHWMILGIVCSLVVAFSFWLILRKAEARQTAV